MALTISPWRRTWTWRCRQQLVSSISRPPSPSRRILGRISETIPLFSIPPAILLPGRKSHPKVLVGSTWAVSVPQPSGQVLTGAHIPASISNMHINVGSIATAGVCTTLEEALPSLLCSAHPTSWQPGCAVCDLALVHASKAPVYDPKLAVADRLLGCIARAPTHAVELGTIRLEVARHVCHQQKPMAAKEASHLMATSLKLPAAQELELNSNLRAEAFFQDFEKQRAFQSQFEYKRKLLGLLKGIRMSMTPLFRLRDKLESFEAKLKLFCGELDITLTELDRDSTSSEGYRSGSTPYHA